MYIYDGHTTSTRCSSWHALCYRRCYTTTVESRNPSRYGGQTVSTFTLVQGLGMLVFGVSITVLIGVLGLYINNHLTRKELREQEEESRLKKWR